MLFIALRAVGATHLATNSLIAAPLLPITFYVRTSCSQFCAATCMHAPICLEIPEPANPKIENGGVWLQKP